MKVGYCKTPFGSLEIRADDETIVSIKFTDLEQNVDNANLIIEICKTQLKEYCLGGRTDFDLPITFVGTAFQQKVWRELCKIPYGKTVSYSEIARKIGNSKAVRAVGSAIGKNPLAIVVPCHRVIGANGSMTGYAYGIDKKEKLLNWEKK